MWVKRHWKKLAVAVPLVAFAGHFAHGRWLENELVRAECRRAVALGEQTTSSGSKPRKMILFVNPAANNQKTLGYLERSLLPFLHLTGIDLRIVKTEAEGEAKELVSAADDAEAILVAGGDGTVSEIITGMKRSGGKVAELPLSIIPLGYKHNSLARRIYGSKFNSDDPVRNIIEAAHSLIAGCKKELPLMELKPRDFEKSYFSAAGLHIGAFRDGQDERNLEKKWYLGPLKKYYVALATASDVVNNPIKISLKWTVPCPGCIYCKADLIKSHDEAIKNRKWWQRTNVQKNSDSNFNKYLKRANKFCKEVLSMECFAHQLVASPSSDCIEISICSVSTWSSFVRELLSRYRNPRFSLQPCSSSSTAQKIKCKEFWLEVGAGDESVGSNPEWFSIDNENFEATPLHGRHQPNKLTVFS